jgi:thioredoxin 1
MKPIHGWMRMGCVAALGLLGTMGCKPNAAPESTVPDEAVTAPSGLPRLVCLGAGQCIPCKAMEPVREALKADYAGRLQVEFLDVWQHPDLAEQYGVETIPTTIFVDPAGQERHREVGAMTKEDILAKWTELGVELGEAAPEPSPES